jgi:hypothetical protein
MDESQTSVMGDTARAMLGMTLTTTLLPTTGVCVQSRPYLLLLLPNIMNMTPPPGAYILPVYFLDDIAYKAQIGCLNLAKAQTQSASQILFLFRYDSCYVTKFFFSNSILGL